MGASSEFAGVCVWGLSLNRVLSGSGGIWSRWFMLL
jgi:hypothetical protein